MAQVAQNCATTDVVFVWYQRARASSQFPC